MDLYNYGAIKDAILEIQDANKINQELNTLICTGYAKNEDGTSIKGQVNLQGTHNYEMIRIFGDTTINLPSTITLKVFTVYLVTWLPTNPKITFNGNVIINAMVPNKLYILNLKYISPSIGWNMQLLFDSTDDNKDTIIGNDAFLWYNSSDYQYTYNADKKYWFPDRLGRNDYFGSPAWASGGIKSLGGMVPYNPTQYGTNATILAYEVSSNVVAGSTLLDVNGITLSEGFLGDEFTLTYYVGLPDKTNGSIFYRNSYLLSLGTANVTPQNCIMIKAGQAGTGFIKVYDGTTLAGTIDGIGNQEMAHFAITYSKIAAQAKVYKNGVLLNTFTLTGEANIGNRLLIAGGFEQTKPPDSLSYGSAVFQDLKIYNKIKTAEELLEEYNILANNGGLLD